MALCLSVMTVTTVGYGDVQPKTTGERVYLIIAMLFGASMQAYVVGSICGIISNLNQTSGEFNQVMDAHVNAFISENKVDPELARRLRSLYQVLQEHQVQLQEVADGAAGMSNIELEFDADSLNPKVSSDAPPPTHSPPSSRRRS